MAVGVHFSLTNPWVILTACKMLARPVVNCSYVSQPILYAMLLLWVKGTKTDDKDDWLVLH